MSAFDNTLGQRPKKYPSAPDSDPSAALGTAAPLGPLSSLGAPRPNAPAFSPSAPLSSPPAQPSINRPKDPALAALQTSYAPVSQGYDAANAQVQDLTAKRDALQGVVKPDLVIPRNDFAPVTRLSATPGGVTALQAVTAQLGQATQARDAYIPKLNAAAQGFRDYTERTNANTLLRQNGVAPLPLPPPASATTPARNPAAARTAASPGGISATTSVLPPRENFATVQGSQLHPGDANTFTFSNGKTVPVPGMTAQATTAALNGQSSASPLPFPAAYAAAPAPTPSLAVNVPRPVVADPYNTREANADLKKIADTLDISLFRNSFAADRGSRSARDAQAQMLGTLAELGGKRLDVAANVAGGDRDTAAKYDLTGLEQTGANQQALLRDQGDTTRTGLATASQERVAYLQSLADMAKTQAAQTSTLTDENGNLLRVSDAGAQLVLDANGKPVRPLQAKTDRPDANTIVAQYNERAKALDANAAAYGNGKPADYSALDASPLGQAYRQVLAGMPGGQRRAPTSADVAKLQAHPEWASYFDEAFGKGAAARVLGGAK